MKNRAVVTFGGSFKYRIYIFINILSSTGLLACIMMTGPDTELGNSEHLQDIGNIQLYQKKKKKTQTSFRHKANIYSVETER